MAWRLVTSFALALLAYQAEYFLWRRTEVAGDGSAMQRRGEATERPTPSSL